MNAIVPKCEIHIRTATLADLPFIDGLQKRNYRSLGYFPTKQFEEYITAGAVLVAEQVASCKLLVASEETAGAQLATSNQQLATPLGYIISRDRYLKRDELGVIFQLCVVPGEQRKLVGASLLKAVFERSAYGCRLYCCWCAQDLAANWFWESMGFIPLAFRAGSGRKKRVHIFWQRRIVEGDETTPLWYPFQTNAGAIRADRLVLPIMPGVHWKDVQAVELPKAERALPEPSPASEKAERPRKQRIPKIPQSARHEKETPVHTIGGIRLAPPAPEPAPEPTPAKPPAPRQRKPAERIGPKYLAGARELRDRYLERVNSTPMALAGKYAVGRALPDAQPNRPALLEHYPDAA
jgi:hypothetical protein